jgi:hypothetical protein
VRKIIEDKIKRLFNKMVKTPPSHANEYEHTSSILKFFGTYVFFGLLGGVVGRIVDKIVVHAQNGRTSRASSIFFTLLQILFNGIIFFTLFKIVFIRDGIFTFISTEKTMTFDDWLSGTFQGLIFATTIYSAQDQLPLNLKRIF